MNTKERKAKNRRKFENAAHAYEVLRGRQKYARKLGANRQRYIKIG